MMKNFERGSEWRKWDLHVHSPKSFLGNRPGYTSIDDFVNTISESQLVAIGLTNYFRFDDLELTDIKNKLNQKGIVVFPNIELRVGRKNKDNELMHIHILFSDTLPKEKISNFLVRLETIDGKCCKDLTLEKIKTTYVGLDTLKKTLADDSDITHLEDYLTIACPRGQGSFRPSARGDGRDITTAIVIDKDSDIFFGNANDRAHFLDKSRYKNAKEKPVLLCSDAHKMSDIGGKFSWIKADPTFEGLKQIIYEPELRVHIGEEPPIMNKVRNNKTKYIHSLKIDHVNKKYSGDTWFKGKNIPFNNELVAIIGNKGSGKSGIADILGLVGDAQTDREHFSFLHQDKFLKDKLASNFKAQVVWESGTASEEIRLNEEPKTDKPESVRYIPQNYFEELTNELEISKFQNVLENIIFEYIPDAEKLGKSNFKELQEYMTENVNHDIENQENKIKKLNEEIIELEKKNNPNYLAQIEGFINQKQREITEQEKLLSELLKIPNPKKDDKATQQENTELNKLHSELEDLNENLEKREKEQSTATHKLVALQQLKEKIQQQEQYINDFITDNEEEAKAYQLNVKAILKIETNYESIDKAISETKKELVNIDIFLESAESVEKANTQNSTHSVIYKIKIIEDKIKFETDKLSKAAKSFQENMRQRKIIDEKIKELTGSIESPISGTLEFHKKEKKFVENTLSTLLKEKREERVNAALAIFNKKKEIINLYANFKKSVDEKIAENKKELGGYDIKIDSSFVLNQNFYDEFLGYINQRRSGCFYGTADGKEKIKTIVDECGFASEDEIRELLNEIIVNLEQEESGIEIADQINPENLNNFYDYVFSLSYIEPTYKLKLGEKILSQLSPGERGALLLIFYLVIDQEETPLIIDQPEDNLDNESVYNMLSKFIKQAKIKRQIIMVTHNPNLAVGADAEQIIYVEIEKSNKNKFLFISGSIENPKINKKIVQILEGTKPAFDKRKLKYQDQ